MIEAIHLFAGPGGLECGAEAEGVCGTGIEWDANAVATRVAAGLATTHGDVTQYGPADFPNATVLAGGPPCQTFRDGQIATAGMEALKADVEAFRAREPHDWVLHQASYRDPNDRLTFRVVVKVNEEKETPTLATTG